MAASSTSRRLSRMRCFPPALSVHAGFLSCLIPQFAGLGYNPQQRVVDIEIFPELGGVDVDSDTCKRNG